MPEALAPVRLSKVEFIEEDHKAVVLFYFGSEIDANTGDYETLSEEVACHSPDTYTPDQIVTRAALNLTKRLEKAVAHLAQKYGRED